MSGARPSFKSNFKPNIKMLRLNSPWLLILVLPLVLGFLALTAVFLCRAGRFVSKLQLSRRLKLVSG
jgi:hypothetical protein